MSLVSGFSPLDLKTLLEPLGPGQPAGRFDEDDETFQAIDAEMMKLGGLHQAALNWTYVDQASRRYLAQQCKHFRVAGHLITAYLRARSWQAWIEALGLFAGLTTQYWETGHPKPGPGGYGLKRKLAAMLIERLVQASGDLDPHTFTKDQQAFAQEKLGELQAVAATAQLDAPLMNRLEAKLRQATEATQAPDTASSKQSSAPSQGPSASAAISEEFFSTSNTLRLGEERDNRRSLLAVADLVNLQDPYDPTGYQLRRFALWGHLRVAPAARREQRTELMGVPGDIVDGYQEALTRNAVNPVLLQRVEKSVVASPYWIRGSFLAAGIAERLEMKEVAEAIRHAATRFITRMPIVAELCFSDGRPFVDPETRSWLGGASEDGHRAAVAVPEYAGLREELVAQLDQEGVEVVLRRLQDLQSTFHAPRQRCYATVIAADLLASRGLSWLAADLYASVGRLMQVTLAEQWEPDLYGHLAKQNPPSLNSEQRSKGQEAS
ncbi:hypothetical protein AWB80_04401 [Caballeronia pedi]|uniref:ImpA N-terminal domain-containing protein n=1 Tax=Caballeronia pedi TaxID=1777141 RepID=A0A158C0Q9_9BURK|nr:type VI secretion system protein TssA [Caballeronia pedi]SAK75939.1 hypothetical protein AWB80_04401 [Caballeronia pedi]